MTFIHECSFGETNWYVLSVEFPTAFMAKRAWENIDRSLKGGSIGLYRHGPAEDPGRIVSAVSLKRSEILKVARLVRGATDYPLDERTMEGLILRRARVVTEAHEQGMETGRFAWRRPEERGARLDNRTGDMIEPGGQG